MRDEQFIKDSIKMDLLRVTTMSGDISQELPIEAVLTFLTHADKDFGKIKLTKHETKLRAELKVLKVQLKKIRHDIHKRLRWAEKVLTIRSRLY